MSSDNIHSPILLGCGNINVTVDTQCCMCLEKNTFFIWPGCLWLCSWKYSVVPKFDVLNCISSVIEEDEGCVLGVWLCQTDPLLDLQHVSIRETHASQLALLPRYAEVAFWLPKHKLDILLIWTTVQTYWTATSTSYGPVLAHYKWILWYLKHFIHKL
jgi:hypothetical protein